MKKLINISVLLLVLGFLSCEDVLDTSPKGELAEGVSSASVIDKYVISAYQGLMQHFYYSHGESFTAPANNWISDVRSDDAYKGGGGIGDRSDIHQLETATFDPSNYGIGQKWENLMFAIARTNLAIREINALQDATYDKNKALGEMRLLRGHFHFEMYRIYHKIPFLDENADPTKTSNTALTVEKVLEKIGEDFQFAYDNLTPTSEQVGRLNKYVAAAYLAKFYIETEQWDEAADMADYVITGPYDLLANQEDLWTVANENGKESVFAIQYSTENFFANHDWGSLLNVTTSPGIDLGGYAAGDDFYHGSQNLVNAFRTDANGWPLFTAFNDVNVTEGYAGNLDPRLDFTVGRVGIPWKQTAVYDESWMRSTDYPGYSSKKQVVAPDEPGINQTFPWAAAGLNYYIIRYAEVLLWKAEAEIERSAPDLGAALSAINEVRNRAKNSEVVSKLDGSGKAANYKIELYTSFNNVEEARKALRMERRLEMALEGHRLFDLNRWGITSSVMNTYYQNEDRFYLEGMSFTADKHEYFPIPQSQIDLAPNLYEQNNY